MINNFQEMAHGTLETPQTLSIQCYLPQMQSFETAWTISETAVGLIMFSCSQEICLLDICFLMRGENVESQLNIIYRKILLVRSWLWGIQTFGTSTTLLALLWHNSIPNAFILYVHWLWWSGSDRPLSDCAICTLFTSVFVSGWMAVGCTCSLTMATWAHQGLHSKSIWTCSIGDSIRGAQCPA